MPRTVLREFTGGLSNEIDPQNLRNDQGEESLDINLKGFALEPGEGTAPISGGHYYYRGEWITDSKAVSFEESGIGVVKTYNEKRPEFEDIIKDDVNISRSLGPPLPPAAVISGTVVSEGTRGERPAEGSHLLKISETVLGVVDKAPDADSAAQSLETYKADSTTVIDDIHYYGSQAYWIEKSGTNFTVVTRAYNSTTAEFTSSNISSPVCPHNSGGHFFKGGYFVCWDNQFIDSVQLDNVTMSGTKFDTIETTNHSDGGDAGSEGFGTNAGGDFESGAAGVEITGVDIDSSGIISFSQRITTANTVPSAYTDSAKERWLRMPSGSKGCLVVLFRDGMPKSDSESNGTGNYSAGEDDVEVWTDQNKAVFKGSDPTNGWIVPTGKLTTTHSGPDRWVSPKVGAELEALGDIPYGFKYGVVLAENDTWVRIKYVGDNYPEIMVLKDARGDVGKDPVSSVYAKRNLRSSGMGWERTYGFVYNNYLYYKDYIDIELVFPSIRITGRNYSNSIKWTYSAPIGNTGGGFQARTDCSSYAVNEFASHATTGKYGWTYWMPRTWFWDVSGSWISNNGTHSGAGEQAGSWSRSLRSFDSKTKATSQLGTNNIATPDVPGKMHRLCSYVRDGDVTQQGGFSVSKLWTKARITKENTIEFTEAKDKNFRVGDSIRIGQNGTNESLHLNLRGNVRKEKDDNYSLIKEQQRHITAKILKINEGVSLEISPPDPDPLGTGKYLDEDCYPVISSFIDSPYGFGTSDAPGPVCSVIQSDLSSHVLVGHDADRRSYEGDVRTGEIIEVRLAQAPQIETGSETNYIHRGIPWIDQDVRAVDAVVGSAPRIFYTKGTSTRKLYSQKGSGADISATSVTLSLNGGYHVDEDYLTYFDDQGITIFTPDLLSKPYVKANPTLSDGLGLTGNITDARTFVDSSNAVYVCAKIGSYWKFVKTSSTGPESSLLSYDFKKPIGFDGTKIWGITDESSGWDIQYATPFYESNIIGSWVFFANSYETLTPTISAWGQVVDSRIGETGNNGTPRYLSIDWQMDSGNWFETGTPTIGLNHEPGKMIVENTFKWYPIPTSFNLTTSGTGTVIADLSYLDTPIVNTHTPLAPVEVSFRSKVYRDIVFFKASETLLPTAGDTGGEGRITFLGYQDIGQSFYVLSDNSFKVVAQYGREPEDAYRLGQADIAGTAFDASKIGISSFLIGAPNMYNGYGPNIDFYYRASFVNKWGHESAPSPLPSKGITALDSADDCIQVNFNAPFFRLTDTDIDTIRLYRYGGDSSEFMFLSDIPMPTLPFTTEVINGVTVKIPYFPTIAGINSITNGFSRKSSSSPYYLLKTNDDISSLSGFVNSNFLLTATPSILDGSWRVNQLSEIDHHLVTETFTVTNPDPGVLAITGASGGHIWLGELIANDDTVQLTTTGTLPGNLSTGVNYWVVYWNDNNTMQLSLTKDGTAIGWNGAGSGTHTWTKVGFNTTLIEDLNTTDTTVKLTNTGSASGWPTSGAIKLGTEYISYAGVAAGVATVGTIVDTVQEHIYVNSTLGYYYNVSLSGGSGTGVQATVHVEDGHNVDGVTITTAGTGYKVGDVLTIPNSVIGGSGFLAAGSANSNVATAGTEATVVVATLATGAGSLTGCVRGIRDTNGSEHKKGRIKDFTVTAGGTNWGYSNNTSGWFECTSFSESTDQSQDTWLQCNAPGHGLTNANPIMFKTTGTLPALISPAPTVYYASATQTNSFVISGTQGTPGDYNTTGNPFEHDDDFGSGTPSFNGCIIKPSTPMTKVVTDHDTDGNGGYIEFTTTAHGLNENSKVRLSSVATSVAYTATEASSGGYIDFNATGHGLTVGEKVQVHLVGAVVNGGWTTNFTGNFEHQESSSNVSQMSTSGRGTGAKFTIQSASQSPATPTATITQTTAGSGYELGDTVEIRDPGTGGYANTGQILTLTLTSVSGSPALTDGVSINTNYYVISSGLTADVFRLSTSVGGGSISWESAGQGEQVRTSGTLPTGFAVDTDYYVQSPGGGANANIFTLATAPNGTPISFNGTGSGILSWSHSQGSGTGFYGTYEVNSSGVITSGTVENPGTGYTEVPEFLDIYDPGFTSPNLDGAGANLSLVFDSGVSANVVEWELEMEHRNQDTTTLTEAIGSPLTGTTNVVNVTDTSVFPAGAAAPNSPKILIGSEILTYTGKTDTTFTGVTPAIDGTIASTHGLNVLVRSYDEVYGTAQEQSEGLTVTNASIEIEGFGFRDKARTPISSLHFMETDNWPPLGLEYNESLKQFFETESQDDYFRYIKAVGSMYFGALDANLRFSKYGTPEYWPLSAVITLDSEIRCIEEHAGEGIVFTTNSVYRCRGTDPKAMIAFRVPDARGLPAGYEHTVSDFNGGLMWLTASDGIAMYQGGRVSYLTRDKHNIGRLKAPYSCVVDGVYWLFQEPGSGTGFRLELATGEMRLAQTTIEAYYAYFAKALGVGVVVTKDNTINPDRDSEFLVEEIGGAKASNIEWKSKRIDAGEPAIPKALGSIAIVYEALNSSSGETIVGGIRGQALAAELLGLDPDDLDAGDIAAAESQTTSDLYSIFTKYDEPNQTFVVDTDGQNFTNLERRTIRMPLEFLTSTVTVGDRVWNELLADNTSVESVGVIYEDADAEVLESVTGTGDLLFTDSAHGLSDGDIVHFIAPTPNYSILPGNITLNTNYFVNDKTDNNFKVETVVGGGNVQYSSTWGVAISYVKKIPNPTIILDKEPLRTGEGTIYWGNLPMVEVYLNNDTIPSRVFTLPPGDVVEPQSMDLYLRDLRRFRTISVAIQGDVRVQALSLRHYPLQTYQSSTLHHSADVFYKGDIDFRVMLDGDLIYRKELSNVGDDFKEQRIYLPASSFGQRVHYMNESRAGMIESVNFNGSIAA